MKRVRPANHWQDKNAPVRLLADYHRSFIRKDMRSALGHLSSIVPIETVRHLLAVANYSAVANAIPFDHYREVLKAPFNRIVRAREMGAALGVRKINGTFAQAGRKVRFRKDGPVDEPRDERGRWTGGGASGDAGRLTGDAIAARQSQFAAEYGAAVAGETDKLSHDWYTMRPTSHLDAYLQGKLADGPEKDAWAAVEKDTARRLAEAPDRLDLYRGIPGKEAADAVLAARAAGAAYVEIPIHDSQNHTHEAVCATGQRELAAGYAARRWERHGGDPAAAHTGIVLHMNVPKSDIVFATPFSAFTNPYTKGWNEYLVRTHGAPVLKLPIHDVTVATR